MKIETTLEKVNNGLKEIQNNGGNVCVGENSGSVSISGVEARFSFDDGILTVVVDDTPFLVSESYVEDKIREYFN